MKFDVVIMNPPYSKGTTNSDLYPAFTQFALANAGIVAAVTPSRFLISRKNSMKLMKEAIEQKGLMAYKALDSSIFPANIAGGPCYWITGRGQLSFGNSVENSIQLKIKLKNEGVFNMERGNTSLFEDKYISPVSNKTVDHIFRLQKGVPKTRPIDSKDQKIRSLFNGVLFNQRTSPTPDFYEFAGEFTYTANVCSLELKRNETVENLRTYAQSNLWRFLALSTGQVLNGGASIVVNPGWFRDTFPAIDLSRSWDNEQLYTHFNFTAEEIDYIETNI